MKVPASKNKAVRTDLLTYNKYVKQGLWKPIGNPKFYKAGIAVITVNAKVARRDEYMLADIYIIDFYSKNQVAF